MTTPIKTARVQVSKLTLNQDMRGIHKLREKHKHLTNGSCLIAFNTAQTIARIIDWKGGVHTYYCEDGHIFDLDTLSILVKQAFFIELVPGIMAGDRAAQMWEAA